MNRQFEIINGQRVNTKIEWTDYTWNPVGGCLHGCQWQMPDGKVAICYAKGTAEGVASAAYPHGFEAHYWNPERLTEPLALKHSSKIFVGSMADLMGRWVLDHQIEQVLGVCREADQHIFQLLTKNAPRLLSFTFPRNVWVGVSSPPDWMFGRQLDRRKQERMLGRSLEVLAIKASENVTWMSFEPLSWDVAGIVAAYPRALKWAVIGAASDGRKEYPPDEKHLKRLLSALDYQGVPVFFKGNLRSLEWAREHWRADFPTSPPAPPHTERGVESEQAVQMRLM